MAEIDIKNLANEAVGKLELSDEVFNAKLNEPLIWEAVKHYSDSLRSGTDSSATAVDEVIFQADRRWHIYARLDSRPVASRIVTVIALTPF